MPQRRTCPSPWDRAPRRSSHRLDIYLVAQAFIPRPCPRAAQICRHPLDFHVKKFSKGAQSSSKALKGEASESFAPEAECAAQAREVRSKLDALVLSNDAVWQREREREAAGGKVDSPLLLLGPYYFLCWCLDAFFEDRPLARFWFLETVRSLRARLARCVWSPRALCLA